jgi:predicted PurR-regulated permease PerM
MPSGGDRFYARLFAVVALGILGWALFKIFAPFVRPIAWSILLAFLLQPLNTRLVRRLRGRAGLASGLLTVGATLCVILPIAAFGAALPGQVAELTARLPGGAKQLSLGPPSDLLRLAPVAAALDWLNVHFSVTRDEAQQWVAQQSRRLLEFLAARGGTLVLGAFGFLLDLALTLFVLFFFLRDGADAVARLDRVVPLPEERKNALARQLASVTRAVVLGTLVTAVVQGTLVGIGFAVVGFPSPVVFGAIAAALSLLPIGGTALVWAPGAVVLAAQGRWPWAVGLALYGVLVVGVLVNDVLKPRLIAGRAQIETLPVFFGVLGGLAAFGLIGAVLGPVLIAFALAVSRWVEEERLASSPP